MLLRAPAVTEAHGGALSVSMGGLRVSSNGGDVRTPPPILLHKPQVARDAANGSTHRVAVDPCRHEQLISFVLSEWSQKSGLPSRVRACSFERTVRAPR